MESSEILMEGPFSPADIDVRWTETVVSLGSEARAHIESRWAAHLAAAGEQHLFNGPVTRFISAARSADGQRLVLDLGPTDFKTFLVTTLRDRPWFDRHAPATITPAMGNSVLLTHGNSALLGIRSSQTSAYAGRAHLIGGVLDLLATAALPATIAGILSHLRIEMREEARIQDQDLAPDVSPTLLALTRDPLLAQPELMWQWELATPVEEIGARLDPREHSGCILLTKDRMDPKAFARMTPTARAAWEHWRKVSAS